MWQELLQGSQWETANHTPQPPFPEGFELPLFSPKAPSVEATPHLQSHPTALVLLRLDLEVLSFGVHLRRATHSLHLLSVPQEMQVEGLGKREVEPLGVYWGSGVVGLFKSKFQKV